MPNTVIYYHDIDLATGQLINARLHPVTTTERNTLASSYNSGDEGVTVYDITLDTFFVWNGNQWIQVGVTQTQLQQIQEAYNRSVMSVDITQTTTDRTITLNYRDGGSTADLYKFSHIHTQTIPQLEWTVVHNLGKYPSVSIVDSTEEEVIGEVEHIGPNSLKVKFSAAFSGKAYIN